ncbi:MAG: DUF2130 domain-containing protein [Terriglobales bacterium]
MKEPRTLSSDCIVCPSCGNVIPITETLRQQITEEARAELRQELTKEQKNLISKEKELQGKEAKLLEAEKAIDDRVAKRVAAEKAKLSRDALEKARAEVSLQVEDLQADAAEKDKKLQEAQKKELQLRREKSDLEAAKQRLELDVARKVDAERQRIREDALKEADEQHRLKDAEKDHKLQEAVKMNEELRRKLQQGSQQVQGEVLELELEDLLRDSFSSDEILPVPKGIRGADVLQKVNTRTGLSCGLILWEAKHTKNWSDTWISKLRDDQQEARADIAVLVTDVLPKDVDSFGLRDGVWITIPRHVPGLVVALRQTLAEVAQAKRAVAGKNETVETLFNYLIGPEFRHRVEAIVRAFVAMNEELEEEKRVTIRRWAKRAKQLELVVANTSGMYGELQGLIGSSLQPIAALESAESGSGEEETGLTLAAEAQEDLPLEG